jgi:hypothetical protein
MEDENKIETSEEASVKARRKFLKTAAGVAVTAPAVTMLLAAPTKSYAGVPGGPTCDELPYGVRPAPGSNCNPV